MNKRNVINKILLSSDYFVQFNGRANVTNGYKLSIQGKDLGDIDYLYDNLINFLTSSGASYKFATAKLINSGIPQLKTLKLC